MALSGLHQPSADISPPGFTIVTTPGQDGESLLSGIFERDGLGWNKAFLHVWQGASRLGSAGISDASAANTDLAW